MAIDDSRTGSTIGFSGGDATRGNDSRTSGKRAGNGLMDTIRDQATTRLTSQKARAADGLGGVVEAIRQTGQQLREKNGTLAGYADNAAGQLEQWASNLRDRDVNELVDDVKRFAQRRPAVFIGGGVALGLVVARFLKSSNDRMSAGDNPQRFTSTGYRDSGLTRTSPWNEDAYSSTRRNTPYETRTQGGAPSALDVAADRPTSGSSNIPGAPEPRSRR